jgi:CRAL/TRIO domain
MARCTELGTAFDVAQSQWESLDPGLARFSLQGERSVEAQIKALGKAERRAFDQMCAQWRTGEKPTKGKKAKKTSKKTQKLAARVQYSDWEILQFIRCSPGLKKFNIKTCFPVMKNFATWSYKRGFNTPSTCITRLEEQIRTNTLLIPPNLKSKDGYDYLYMKPGRYFPGETPHEGLIDSLVYLLRCLTEREKNCTEGIAFVCNMENWGYSNFSVAYCRSFFETMQGRFPCRVRSFLIVDPPAWFGAIWRIIKSIVTKDFAEKVHMPSFNDVEDYLHESCSIDSLPDEYGGKLDTQKAVDDFIAYRKYVELEGEHCPDGAAEAAGAAAADAPDGKDEEDDLAGDDDESDSDTSHSE